MAHFTRYFYAWACVATMSVCTGAIASSGTVKVVQGQVFVERSGLSLPLQVGDVLQEKDRIVVRAASSAGITLRDDTRISVGPMSTLVINQFAFDPKTQEGSSDTTILRGTMRYVTGLIGRLKPSAVRVASPTSTVGIRGTDFIVEVAGDE